jgi:hypothetical protein
MYNDPLMDFGRFGPVKAISKLAIASIICLGLAIGTTILFSMLVIIGLDLGIFVLIAAIFFILSLILGLLALVVIIFRRKYLKGYLITILSIVISGPVVFVLTGVWFAGKARIERSKADSGEYNLRLLGKELIKYAEDHDGKLPSAEKWCDQLMEYNTELTKNNFVHPRHDPKGLKGDCHFAFNKKLGGMYLSDISPRTIILFESDGPWNLNGTGELLHTRYKKHCSIHVIFADLSVRSYWFDTRVIRDFDPDGKSMFYTSPRWQP